ncbi:hypothetical protein SELMODRAFT_413248 [Selaginella moellendorffii]|uniref:Uncharacterized protein n=1 Tax=Selaginella moellendorffii TaxID=88036 RepID=D8RNU2_SELML|nr:hypothetical protein SELMODRAFT_413248 [Selaginella moellendorffii]
MNLSYELRRMVPSILGAPTIIFGADVSHPMARKVPPSWRAWTGHRRSSISLGRRIEHQQGDGGRAHEKGNREKEVGMDTKETTRVTGPDEYGLIQAFTPVDWNGQKRILQALYVVEDGFLEAAAKVDKWTPAVIEDAVQRRMITDYGVANVAEDDLVEPIRIYEVRERMIKKGVLPAEYQ